MKAITFLRSILAFQQAAQMKCHILADIEILLRAVSLELDDGRKAAKRRQGRVVINRERAKSESIQRWICNKTQHRRRLVLRRKLLENTASW